MTSAIFISSENGHVTIQQAHASRDMMRMAQLSWGYRGQPLSQFHEGDLNWNSQRGNLANSQWCQFESKMIYSRMLPSKQPTSYLIFNMQYILTKVS